MLIENYKGVDIRHNAAKDEFFTNIVINKKSNGKKEFISFPRLQKTRDEIDKFLNTAAKKPVLKKAWMRGRYDNNFYELVDVILLNTISKQVVVKNKEGRETHIELSKYDDDYKIFLSCKENDAIIKTLNEKLKAIAKIEKETSCSGGKLIPFTMDNFK